MKNPEVDRPTVLFLCTGNYYRSRFAEVLFNHRAARDGHPWRAESRGLCLHAGNVGPISQHALAGFERLEIVVETEHRFPLPLTEEDLDGAGHLVALKKTEHLPVIVEQFPDWVHRVEYWQVHDLDGAEPPEALLLIEQEVAGLLQRLAGKDDFKV